jgi:5'-nucleotidase
MPRIFVTNDDGVHAPGLFALVEAMRTLGEVTVVGPAINQSASGHKKTLHTDIPVQHTTLRDGTPALAVSGSPADTISLLSLNFYAQWPPDIVVSGINRGANLGQDVTYSGTVTAALEAAMNGVAAVAVSLDNRDADQVEDYKVAAEVAVTVVGRALEKRMPPLTILNVNIPYGDSVKGIRLTRQGVRVYLDELYVNEDQTIARIVGPAPTGKFDIEGTDVWALNEGYASLTPLHLDLTAHQFLAELAAWDIDRK